jgi:hypothetical protein
MSNDICVVLLYLQGIREQTKTPTNIWRLTLNL